jgi:hypothetical protein
MFRRGHKLLASWSGGFEKSEWSTLSERIECNRYRGVTIFCMVYSYNEISTTINCNRKLETAQRAPLTCRKPCRSKHHSPYSTNHFLWRGLLFRLFVSWSLCHSIPQITSLFELNLGKWHGPPSSFKEYCESPNIRQVIVEPVPKRLIPSILQLACASRSPFLWKLLHHVPIVNQSLISCWFLTSVHGV